MPKRVRHVFKIGGSLGRGDALPRLCRALAKLGRDHALMVVPGGGAFADAVRECGRRFPLGDSPAHWMAILGMEQYGLLLADLIPGAVAATSLEETEDVAKKGLVPVFLPGALLRRFDPLPHSWDVTSDSIAAWIALRAGANLCVLVKDKDGLYARDPDRTPPSGPLPEMSLTELAGCGGVDPYLGRALATGGMDCFVVNGKKPKRLAELVKTGGTVGTRINAK